MPSFDVDIWEIRLRQTFLGQNVVNLFYYKDTDTGDIISLDQISAQFLTDVLNVIIEIQHTGVETVDIRTRKVGGTNEHVLDGLGSDGTRPGEPLNSFSAYGFRLNRTNIDVRNGSKRFAGVSEDDVSGNGVDAILESLAEDVAQALQDDLELNSGAILTPVIYRRESFDMGTWVGTNVSGSVFTGLTSQVSRKASPA